MRNEAMGRPGQFSIDKLIRFNEQMLEAIENWRRKQKPVPNWSEAIRELLQRGLEADVRKRICREAATDAVYLRARRGKAVKQLENGG